MSEAVFELKDIYYSYLGKFSALCGVDLKVLRGERIGIIGANGSGKSTLLQLLGGLVFAQQGEALVFGSPLNEKAFTDAQFARNFRSKVGLVFQNSDVQLFCPTVGEDIAFGLLQLGLSRQEARDRVKAIALEFGIEGLLDRQPHQLSAGEKKKAAIASVFIMEPAVLLLDEPTAGLDPRTSRHIIELIIEAHAQGKTVITATQDLHIVEEISDRVVVFSKDNSIVRSAPVNEVLADQAFLESQNLVHIHPHRHKGQLHIHPHEHLEHHS